MLGSRVACRLATVFLALAAPATVSAQPADVDMLAEPMPPIDGRRVALVIGNGDYDDSSGWSDLANGANDARHIAATLSAPERGAARFEVRLLTDASRQQIMDALEQFARDASNAEIALVYFSGHGFEYNLDNYIVPVDAPGRVDESNVARLYVNMSQVVDAARARGFSLFFLDACRNAGPVLRFTNRTDGSRAALFGAINAPQSAVFYSTAMGHVAYDAAPPGSPLSPFAAAVGRAMNARGLDVPYMFTRVRESVARATRDRTSTQMPQLAGSWSRPFYFLPPNETRGPAAPAPMPAGRLDIPLATLSTLDEPVLITRVLEEHSPTDLIRMAEAGDPLALYLVGYMFEFGVGVGRDLIQARAWLERAAASGHPAGQLELGYFLLAHGTAAERPRGLDLYRRASDQGYAKAKSHLAAALLNGTFGTTDRAEALPLLRDAAAAGHAYALQALAVLGENRDAHVRALEALATAGNAEGSAWLCEIASTEIPIDSAFTRCLAAATAGYANARAHTALLYARGVGVEPSPADARYWARLAVSATDLRADLRPRLAELAD